MSAYLYGLGNRKFQAWCHECQDGINSHRRVTAEQWADNHNDSKHGEEK